MTAAIRIDEYRAGAYRAGAYRAGTGRVPTAATYRRRRAVVGITSALFVAVGAVATHDVLAGSGGVPASATTSRPALVQTVTARPGDTLWSIAAEHRGSVAISRYVDALVEVNGGASIQAGQTVVLP